MIKLKELDKEKYELKKKKLKKILPVFIMRNKYSATGRIAKYILNLNSLSLTVSKKLKDAVFKMMKQKKSKEEIELK
jgi:hypothetical protein